MKTWITLAFALSAASGGAAEAVAWRNNLDAAKIEAAQTNRLLLLHFYTKSCAPCRVLDSDVFSQPSVGQAIEQQYVPVKIDADAAMAIASAYRIDRVPTDVVLTPQGNILTIQGCPATAEGYVTQCSNISRHFQQTTVTAGQPSPSSMVNSAYAGIPAQAAGLPGRGDAAALPAVAQPAKAPRFQNNPYARAPAPRGPAAPTTAATAAAPYGGTPPLFGAPATSAAAVTASAVPPGAPAVAPPNMAAAAPALPAQSVAAQPAFSQSMPTLPGNAMPNSYRGAQDRAAAVAGVGAAAAASVAAATPLRTPPFTSNVAAAAPVSAAAVVAAPATPPAANVAAAKPAAPAPPTLPPGSPPLGFDGYCPVTLRTLKKWVPGSVEFGAVHRGRTYLFAGAAERDQFLADPDAYSPVFAGMDPVLLLDEQKLVPGSRKFGFEYGGRYYLLSSEETKRKFEANYQAYAASVRQAMNRLDANSAVLRR